MALEIRNIYKISTLFFYKIDNSFKFDVAIIKASYFLKVKYGFKFLI